MGRYITAALICLVMAASLAAQQPPMPQPPPTPQPPPAATPPENGATEEEPGVSSSGQAIAPLDAAAAARVRKLIQDLDADEFRIRDDATKALVKAGPAALELLRPALEKARGAEVRLRLDKIIEEIEIWGGEAGELKLDELLDRIPRIAKADWRAAGFRDQRLEVWLTRWVRVLGQAADKKDLKLPVVFGDVTAGTSETFVRDKLVVLGDEASRISSAEKSIILSTGAVNLSHARNCVIIARLGVNMAFCHDSIVIAGVDITTSSAENSVLLSGSQLSVSHPRGSIVAAGDRLDCSFADATTFVNCAPERQAINRGYRSVQVPRLILGNPQRKNSLDGKLTVTFLSASDSGLVLFRLADGSGEYVARKGQPITQPDGRPIEALSGWKLQYVARNLAVFTKGADEEISMLRVGK